jgi:sRNA-binding regulator protein Hfq
VDSVNRKLIRPSLSDSREPGRGRNGNHRKNAPPDQTNAENFYYMKQMQSKTPMVVVMKDGEELHGIIEWYDKCSLKLNRVDAPNLLIFKPNIKYMYKASDRRP